MSVRRALLAAVLSVASIAGSQAWAGELPAAVRRMAERAFLEGRLDDLDAILAGAKEPLDRFPLDVRDTWWRRGAKAEAQETPPADEGLRRRRAWLEAPPPRGPYPEAGGGEEPYPILTALIRDRARRETRGALGLPLDGPLEALVAAGTLDPVREERATYFLGEWTRWLMSSTYRGPPPDEEQLRARRRAEDLRVRNGRWALVALGLFAGFVLALVALTRRLPGLRTP